MLQITLNSSSQVTKYCFWLCPISVPQANPILGWGKTKIIIFNSIFEIILFIDFSHNFFLLSLIFFLLNCFLNFYTIFLLQIFSINFFIYACLCLQNLRIKHKLRTKVETNIKRRDKLRIVGNWDILTLAKNSQIIILVKCEKESILTKKKKPLRFNLGKNQQKIVVSK